jgi:hypothetical protein
MISLAPWKYRNLLIENNIIDLPEFYKVDLPSGHTYFEAVCSLKKELRPSWVSISEIYGNRDGAGASKFKNIATYKAISEALERWAFYTCADDSNQKEFRFDENPSTTGMAAFPSFSPNIAREKAILEGSERWALHEFWRGNLPIVNHSTLIKDLLHFEIITPIKNVKISLISYKMNAHFLYSFAAERSLEKSFEHALIELGRNQRVLSKLNSIKMNFFDFKDISDKRMVFFSSQVGNELFNSKIMNAPRSVLKNPKLICDKEIKGDWSQYTSVWRYLFQGSYPDSETDHTFFMF